MRKLLWFAVWFSFHEDPVPQEATAAVTRLRHPLGHPGRAHAEPLSRSGSLSPSACYFPAFKRRLRATSVLPARLGSGHLYGSTRRMNDHVLVLPREDAKQMLAIKTIKLLWTLPGVRVL